MTLWYKLFGLALLDFITDLLRMLQQLPFLTDGALLDPDYSHKQNLNKLWFSFYAVTISTAICIAQCNTPWKTTDDKTKTLHYEERQDWIHEQIYVSIFFILKLSHRERNGLQFWAAFLFTPTKFTYNTIKNLSSCSYKHYLNKETIMVEIKQIIYHCYLCIKNTEAEYSHWHLRKKLSKLLKNHLEPYSKWYRDKYTLRWWNNMRPLTSQIIHSEMFAGHANHTSFGISWKPSKWCTSLSWT